MDRLDYCCIVAALVLAGCAGPSVRECYIGETRLVEHVNTGDSPCRAEAPACHQKRAGLSHVWLPSSPPPYLVRHEAAHVFGMHHTEWSAGCAMVTHSGGRYLAGQTICMGLFDEIIYNIPPT